MIEMKCVGSQTYMRIGEFACTDKWIGGLSTPITNGKEIELSRCKLNARRSHTKKETESK
jgi:hypothetical protein